MPCGNTRGGPSRPCRLARLPLPCDILSGLSFAIRKSVTRCAVLGGFGAACLRREEEASINGGSVEDPRQVVPPPRALELSLLAESFMIGELEGYMPALPESCALAFSSLGPHSCTCILLRHLAPAHTEVVEVQMVHLFSAMQILRTHADPAHSHSKLPHYPPATPAFQRLSYAYETLSKPGSRRLYDVDGGRGYDPGKFGSLVRRRRRS